MGNFFRQKFRSPYTPVRGKNSGLLVNSALFRGPDHYLYMSGPLRLTERYRRIAHNQITGLQVLRTRNRLGINVIGLLITAAFILLWSTLGPGPSALFWILLTGLPLTLIALNTAAGPTCRVYLYTRRRRHRLLNFQRLKSAQAFAEELAQLLPVRDPAMGAPSQDPASTINRTPAASTPPPPPSIREVTSWLFPSAGLFMLTAATGIAWLMLHSRLPLIAMGFLSIGSFLCVVGGILRQYRLGPNTLASRWFLSGLIFHLAEAGILYLLCLPLYFRLSITEENMLDRFEGFLTAAEQLPWPFFIFVLVSSMIQAVLGWVGLRIAVAGGKTA